MGCGKPNDKDNPPVPFKHSDELAPTTKESEVSDYGQISHVNGTSASAFMSFPFVPNSLWDNAHGMHQSYTQDPRISNNLPASMRSGTSQSAHNDCSFTDLRGGLRNRDTFPSGPNQPQVNVNFFPNPSTIPGGYYIHAHVGEGKASDVNRSLITESSLYSGCDLSMAQSTRETFVTNDAKVGASYPGKIDGSFLTLGIGGNAESKTKHEFSSCREIARNLEQSCDFHVAQTAAKFSTLSHNLTGCSSGFQSNPGGFPGSMSSSLGAMTSSCNSDGILHYGVVGLSSNSFQSTRVPEAYKQYNFFESNDRNLGIASKSTGAYQAHGPYNHYQGDPSPPFLPFGNTNTFSSHPGFNKFSDPASESAKFMWSTFQPTMAQPQNYHARNDRDATSSFGLNPISLAASPITQDYLGKLIPPAQGFITKAVGGGPAVQPIGHISSTLGVNSATSLGNTTFPEKIVPQIAEATAFKPATVSPFPRSLGVQPDVGPRFVSQGMPPRMMGVQTRSAVQQSQPVQLTRSLLGPPPSAGYPRDSLPPKSDGQTPLFSSGPVPLGAKADKPSQVCNAVDQPSLKRKAAEPPPVASWGRRRKLVHLPTTHNPVNYPRGTAATLPPPVPSATPHIRWQGFDKLPQPVGNKCLLCNRDLSFTPEGPVLQPTIPPAVAVLPCGHAFHDNCLQRITPEDQIKDPPCIPCAIGET